jgi:hypothetical protein
MEALYAVARLEYATAPSDEGERLDRYRTTLEPYLYHYLLEHHLPTLNAFWETYLPPRESRHAFVLVERRPHPNFEFILKNIAWAGPTFSVYLFCSDANAPFLRAILKDKAPHYHILPVFQGLGTREQGKADYNRFLTDAASYRQMAPAEYIMTVQMDMFFRQKIPEEVFQGDYWGNPWAWDQDSPGGGGGTIRRVAFMTALCEEYGPGGEENEDSWLGRHTIQTGGVYPPALIRGVFFMESIPAEHPYVLHQFWTFLDGYMKLPREECTAYWKHLLTLCV